MKRSLCFCFAWISPIKNCIKAERRRFFGSTIHHPSMLSCSLLLQLFHWSGKSQEFLQAAVRVHYENELLPNELELMWRASTSGPKNHGERRASVAVWELAVFQHVCRTPGGTRAYKCHLCARADIWQTWEGLYMCSQSRCQSWTANQPSAACCQLNSIYNAVNTYKSKQTRNLTALEQVLHLFWTMFN